VKKRENEKPKSKKKEEKKIQIEIKKSLEKVSANFFDRPQKSTLVVIRHLLHILETNDSYRKKGMKKMIEVHPPALCVRC